MVWERRRTIMGAGAMRRRSRGEQYKSEQKNGEGWTAQFSKIIFASMH